MEIIRRAMDMGARDYLIKPILPKTLLETLHNVLHQVADYEVGDDDEESWEDMSVMQTVPSMLEVAEAREAEEYRAEEAARAAEREALDLAEDEMQGPGLLQYAEPEFGTQTVETVEYRGLKIAFDFSDD